MNRYPVLYPPDLPIRMDDQMSFEFKRQESSPRPGQRAESFIIRSDDDSLQRQPSIKIDDSIDEAFLDKSNES